jgi:hypothetical protein
MPTTKRTNAKRLIKRIAVVPKANGSVVVLRFLIHDLGVVAQSKSWHAMRNASEKQFKENFNRR